MNLIEAIILGIIQGVTEWLPVSSSGHLVLAQHLMKLEVPIAFDVLLHVATLLAVLIFFRKDIWSIAKDILAFRKESYNFKFGVFIILATLVTSLIVLLFLRYFESAFFNLFIIGISFIATGFILLISEKRLGEKNFSAASAGAVGFSQAIAFIPGISRSGATISTALLLGIKRQQALKFSFLLSVPAIIGTAVLKLKDLASFTIPISYLTISFITAFAFGYSSIFLLSKIIAKKRFHYFGYYCFAIGILTLIIYFI